VIIRKYIQNMHALHYQIYTSNGGRSLTISLAWLELT